MVSFEKFTKVKFYFFYLNEKLSELFAEKNNSLLLKRDIFEMTPRDRATFWHKRVTSRRLRHAEAEYNLKSDTREHSKLLKLKVKLFSKWSYLKYVFSRKISAKCKWMRLKQHATMFVFSQMLLSKDF